AKKQHVPIMGNLFDGLRKNASEVRMKNDVVFNDQNARGSVDISLLNYSQMTLQTGVCSRKVIPIRWDLNAQSIDCREANDTIDVVLSEPRLHSLPAIASPFEVNADLIGKDFV